MGEKTGGTPLTPYRPRHFRFVGVREHEGFRVKFYTIGCNSDPIEESCLKAAEKQFIEEMIPAANREEDHHNLGFVILHEGEMARWLLLHWWAHADICCQLMAYWQDGTGFVLTDRPLHACVWEGVVISHEHRAWVEAMLSETPDPARYLSNSLPDGRY